MRFTDEALIGSAGLVALVGLLTRVGLAGLVDDRWRGSGGPVGASPGDKVVAIVAGMAAGADSIDDLGLLRHGAMGRVFGRVAAPSTLGTFLRAVTIGQVAQLGGIAARFVSALVAATPVLEQVAQRCYIDVDDTLKVTYGAGKQGSGVGYRKQRGLNALLATISTPGAAPLILASRLRSGVANSARGAGSFVAAALASARRAGATGITVLRADSGFYTFAVVSACGRAGALFSITARLDTAVRAAIGSIPDHAWVPIQYPNAVWDAESDQWISDAEIAETSYTAFTGNRTRNRCRRRHQPVTARLIVRRVRRLNPATATGQNELFQTWRYHAVFTNSDLPLPAAESAHRAHAIIEQTVADLKGGPLAHLPSGRFTANAAWLHLAAISHNTLRAVGSLASDHHRNARPHTIRAQLINVPARTSRSARTLTLNLPTNWPWQAQFERFHNHACHPT